MKVNGSSPLLSFDHGEGAQGLNVDLGNSQAADCINVPRDNIRLAKQPRTNARNPQPARHKRREQRGIVDLVGLQSSTGKIANRRIITNMFLGEDPTPPVPDLLLPLFPEELPDDESPSPSTSMMGCSIL
ncbi:unnamed protein product [Phytophthora fragariaefolia]|uniref:Unnamed protein product n=1 Tax=Phytophthora fragariaefolia TaxID=1490495 RepID=A0A9W6XMX7_9STRA|nr:unnamed protein product [Phytophthora fragariaefolia]